MRLVRFTQTAKIKYRGLLCKYIQDAQQYLRSVFMSMFLQFRGKKKKGKLKAINYGKEKNVFKKMTYF